MKFRVGVEHCNEIGECSVENSLTGRQIKLPRKGGVEIAVQRDSIPVDAWKQIAKAASICTEVQKRTNTEYPVRIHAEQIVLISWQIYRLGQSYGKVFGRVFPHAQLLNRSHPAKKADHVYYELCRTF